MFNQSINQSSINLLEPNWYRNGYAGASIRLKQELVSVRLIMLQYKSEAGSQRVEAPAHYM
jgi:hypothetical protein